MNHYYNSLGLSSNATRKDIKKAYRKMVMLYHPDKNSSPQASQKFIEIQYAYDFLIKLKSGHYAVPDNKYSNNKNQSTNIKSSTADVSPEERRKAVKKAKITSRYKKAKSNLEGDAKLAYFLICFFAIFFGPIIGALLANFLGMGDWTVVTVFLVPILITMLGCRFVFYIFEEKRRVHYQKFKMKLKKL